MLGAPLTKHMVAALELLAAHRCDALVRELSQWWLPEGDTGPMDWIQSNNRARYVTTATVNALVARGLLKFTGTKRRVYGPGQRKEWWRAEATPLAMQMRQKLEQQAGEAYADVLALMRTTPTE
jgi:hypothetical protein